MVKKLSYEEINKLCTTLIIRYVDCKESIHYDWSISINYNNNNGQWIKIYCDFLYATRRFIYPTLDNASNIGITNRIWSYLNTLELKEKWEKEEEEFRLNIKASF